MRKMLLSQAELGSSNRASQLAELNSSRKSLFLAPRSPPDPHPHVFLSLISPPPTLSRGRILPRRPRRLLSHPRSAKQEQGRRAATTTAGAGEAVARRRRGRCPPPEVASSTRCRSEDRIWISSSSSSSDLPASATAPPPRVSLATGSRGEAVARAPEQPTAHLRSRPPTTEHGRDGGALASQGDGGALLARRRRQASRRDDTLCCTVTGAGRRPTTGRRATSRIAGTRDPIAFSFHFRDPIAFSFLCRDLIDFFLSI
jgi:hypothetical protein